MRLHVLFIHSRYPNMNRVTFHIVGRKDKVNKRGEMSLCLHVTANGQRDLIPLSLMVPQKAFDEKTREMRSSAKNAHLINEMLGNAKTKALEVLRDADKANLLLDKKTFRSRFARAFGDDFISFWDGALLSRRSALSKETYKGHKSQLKKFKEFKPSISFSMINTAMIEAYEAFLIRKGNNVNTRRTSLKVLQTYINIARDSDIQIKDPFQKYKIPAEQSTRESLSKKELQKLVELYDKRELPEHLQTTTMLFLLSCFTAMRIGDVLKFGSKMLKEGKLIYMPKKTSKQEKVIKITMTKISTRLINDVLRHKNDGGTIKSGQKINEDLKHIAAAASITMNLTFHVSRHTFATTFLRIGGSLETLQRIMCHAKMSTTQLYAHMIDDRIEKEMNNFNNEFE